MSGIWVLSEDLQQVRELLSQGKKLARSMEDNLSALTFSREMAEACISYGADEVLLLPPLPPNEVFSAYLSGIVTEVFKADPEVILVSATMNGREMAAKLAQKLNTGLCSQCINMQFNPENGKLEMDRLILGGAAIQTVVCLNRPCLATVPPHTFTPAELQDGPEGKIKELKFSPGSPVKILAHKPVVQETSDLGSARIIICAGRGIEKEEDLKLIYDLAQLVGGEIGCTRPISEELHWLPAESCIGLSGQQVRPDLYIGIGVSGQVQHITGIRDARVVCAINCDEAAPIFEVSDYGLNSDLYEVIPILMAVLKEKLKDRKGVV